MVLRLQELAGQTARDLHRVALELRPSTLDDLGLVKAVRHLADTWSAHSGIEVEVECAQYTPTGISAEAETTLYRIIQEVLNNVAKHSGAKRASIVHRAADHAQAIIEDDGCGFDPTKPCLAADHGGGLGLSGIEERLSLMGGEPEHRIGAKAGTTWIVRIPIPKTK